MNDQLSQRAKEIIENILYITVATCSKDGQPWNTPVYCAYDEDYNHALKYLDGRVSKKKDPETRFMEFQGKMPRRVYKAVPEKWWMNDDGEINGHYIDVRKEIFLK